MSRSPRPRKVLTYDCALSPAPLIAFTAVRTSPTSAEPAPEPPSARRPLKLYAGSSNSVMTPGVRLPAAGAVDLPVAVAAAGAPGAPPRAQPARRAAPAPAARRARRVGRDCGSPCTGLMAPERRTGPAGRPPGRPGAERAGHR